MDTVPLARSSQLTRAGDSRVFAIPGLIGLIVFIYMKPQEFITPLERLPFLYMFLALAVIGLAMDVRGKIVRLATGPHLPYVVLFYVWCMITAVIKTGGAGLVAPIVQLSIAVTLYILISTAVQTFKVYEIIVGTLVAVSLFVGFVGFPSGALRRWSCAVEEGKSENLRPDGRPCKDARGLLSR